MRTGGVFNFLFFGDLPMIFQYAFGELWVSWASPQGGMHNTFLCCCFVLFFCLHVDDMRTRGVSLFLIFGEASMSNQSAFGKLWVSWASPHHQGRRVECIAPFFLFCLSHVDDMRTGRVSHLLIFGELSMLFQSAFGELWVSWVSRHYQRGRVECIAPFFFIILMVWELEKCLTF